MDANPAKRRKTDHSAVEAAAAASAGLFRPSAFILETAELLEQSRVDYDKLLPQANDLLRQLKSAIERIETHGPVLIAKATSAFEAKHGVQIPYPTPRPAPDSLLKLSMERPAQCNVVGSFVSRTMVRSQRAFSVDMIVEMPRSLFQEKDYLDCRYFYKRAYYLAHVAVAVAAEPALAAALDLSFAYLHDNPLLPVLVAQAKTTRPASEAARAHASSSACAVRIIPCTAADVFSAKKLLANKSCLRAPDTAHEAAPGPSSSPPTPFYNSTVQADSCYMAYLKLLHQARKACSAFGDACMLGRVWLQQRGLDGSMARGGFGAFEWAALVALLMQTAGRKKTRSSGSGGGGSSSSSSSSSAVLSPSLSSTQIFKAVIQFLAATDLSNGRKPCLVGGSTSASGIDSLRQDASPVLFDVGRGVNLAYKMSPWSAALLRHYARRTHELLKQEALANPFTHTFITKADIALEAFDFVARVRCPGEGAKPADEEAVAGAGVLWNFGSSVYRVLKRALGDRATLVSLQLPAWPSWPLDAAVPVGRVEAGVRLPSLTVGILFDPVHMARHIDHGPPAEEKKEARRFHQFWGDRAELRRFKDGSILETLVWEERAPAALCEEIVRYILGHRLALTAPADLVVLGADFAPLVPLTPVADKARFALARQAFETLERDLRGLDAADVPLHIRQLAAIAPELRSASIHPPPVGTEQAALHPMDVVLFFEASGRWPDSLAAIQRAKMAFLLRIGEALAASKASSGNVVCRVGLEEADGLANAAFLDIVYRDNDPATGDVAAAFRLRIHCDLEESLLERRVKEPLSSTQTPRARSAAAQQLARHRRLYTQLPLHNQVMATFTTRLPALSDTVRLAKQWFSRHQLTCHFAPEFVELVVLHVFLRPFPWQTPASATAGLLRTLQFLARWDWHTEPLVVDTSASSVVAAAAAAAAAEANAASDASASISEAAARTRLEAWRKIDPNMNHAVLFVAATHATSGTAFTSATASPLPAVASSLLSSAADVDLGARPLPCKMVASRMTSLARAACRLVRQHNVEPSETAVAAAGAISAATHPDLSAPLLFQPSLGDYDVLIHLSPRVLDQLVVHPAEVELDSDNVRPQPVSRYKNLDGRTGRALQPLPAHPASLLLARLDALYGSSSGSGSGGMGPLVFFQGEPALSTGTGASAATLIAATWNPQMHRRPFRVNMPTSYRPVQGKKEDNDDDDDNGVQGEKQAKQAMEVNRGAILAEMARMGGAAIARIQVLKQEEAQG